MPTPTTTPSPIASTRIIKKLAPGQPGAKRLTQRWGEQLVCVRYRQDLASGRRYTTVELLVDEGPIPVDMRLPDTLHVRVAYGERDLGRALRQQGGQWDRSHQVWQIGKDAVKRLDLFDRVVRDIPGATRKPGKK